MDVEFPRIPQNSQIANMNRPRFSIVIPTRQRARTLEVAIKTCLAQSFDDYEIVVADNASDAETKSVVDRLASEKIRYHRSETPLAMSANWEVGVSLAAGEYITVIGDDDGLLLHSLTHADRLISANNLSVLHWPWVFYNWPDYAGPDWPNRLSIPLPCPGTIAHTRTLIREVVSGRAHYSELPMLYNSFVRKDILSRIRSSCGRIFSAMSPDIYSGFAVAMSVDAFATTGYPLGIAGRHAASNGEACLHGVGPNNVMSEFYQLNSDAGLFWHTNVPPIRWSLSAVVADSFQTARDAMRWHDIACVIDRGQLARRIAEDLLAAPSLDADVLGRALSLLEQAMPDQIALIREQEGRLAARSQQCVSRSRCEKPSMCRGLKGGVFEIDGRDFGLEDCTDAAQLVEKLFGYASQDPARTSCQSAPARSHNNGLSRLRRAIHSVCPPICWQFARRLLGKTEG